MTISCSKLTEELQQQNTELQGKLGTKSTECGRLEDSVIDLKGRLEMAELHVEQVSRGSCGSEMPHFLLF